MSFLQQQRPVHISAPTRFTARPTLSTDQIKMMNSGGSLGDASNLFKELGSFIDDREFESQIDRATQTGDIGALLSVKPRNKEQAFQLQNARGIFDALNKQELQREQMLTSGMQRQVAEQALNTARADQERRQQAFSILDQEKYANIPQEVLRQGAELDMLGVPSGEYSKFNALMPEERIRQEMIAFNGKSPTLEKLKLDRSQSESFSKQNRDQFVKDNLAKFMMENPNATEDDINQASIRFASDYHTATKSALSGERGIGKIEDTRSSIGGSFTGFAIGSEKFNKLDNKRQSAIRQVVGKLENSTSGKALISSMKGKIGDFNAMSKTASRIAPLLGKEVNTNLWNSFVDTIQTYTGMEGLQNIQDQQVRTDVMSIGSLMLKIQSGATVSDKERADFYRSMGSLAQTSPALMVGLRNKLETSLAAMTGDRYLEPDLYDLKFGESTDIMKNAIATIDNNLVKYGGQQQSKVNVSAGDYSGAFRKR